MLNQKELHGYIPPRFDDVELEAKWFDIESEYRAKYTGLTDEDLEYSIGEFDFMIHTISFRTHRSSTQVRLEIMQW